MSPSIKLFQYFTQKSMFVNKIQHRKVFIAHEIRSWIDIFIPMKSMGVQMTLSCRWYDLQWGSNSLFSRQDD